ncbi:uncharacterized protein SPPG_00237 [Spizellomyces punctatus DAOM BR117]|uniref:t-SNARE coiled-coil homology domain-containing protein n=1 Tax=Spizellomyces punctatus (strain DAOM BR117) TaxID=645134 RepID=A0A0L0HUG2_SPIPD|nr:uncharacterized protein SPPG_00237 [Spizellomyces punctatus DAOM BR117]KND04509.1 hypothetical protein SPPG_00237 [Spizellomyces punctatus DAOM BR117]|eukprot:XP_016612548.1 hypothetical protein SPPG_00237 [Spizellomyces punctatus DAOM BR117]
MSNRYDPTDRLLDQNDESLSNLTSKVSTLKHISMDIYDGVQEDHRRLDDISTTFTSARTEVMASARRLHTTLTVRYGRNAWKIVGCLVGVVVVWLVWRRWS